MVLVWGPLASADEPVDEVRLRFTLAEVPDTAVPRATWPTMDVSLGVAVGVDRLAVLGVHSFYDAAFPDDEGLRKGLGLATAGALAGGLVFVNAWAHEEWHRAVLGRAGVSSRNGLYHPASWSNGLIAVDRVSDAGLSAFKRDHPADYVRMSSVGMEAQYAIGRQLGDSVFFGDEVGALGRAVPRGLVDGANAVRERAVDRAVRPPLRRRGERRRHRRGEPAPHRRPEPGLHGARLHGLGVRHAPPRRAVHRPRSSPVR